MRGINAQGKASYQSMIVVAPDSPIKNLQQLKGKHFAFGSADSTQGHLIPRIVLHEAGIELEDFVSYDYTGSHSACANAVASAKFDACGMQDTMAQSMETSGLLRIIHRSREYPSSGIAVHKNVPPEVITKVRQALLEFDPLLRHESGLYHWERTEMPGGFVAAADTDYAELTEWLVKLELLSN